MGALGSCAIVVAIDMPELRDAVYIGADGVLAMVTFLVLFKGLVAAIAPLAIGLAPYFRAGRSSPYLKLMFASNRTLGADYAGGALSWKDWFRPLRPWAVVIGALTYVVSIIVMMVARKVLGKDRNAERAIRDSVFAAGGALFVWTKRKSALGGTAMRQIDSRPPVLLLRSFDDDMMIVLRGARNSRSTDLHRKGMTFERVVQDHLAPFGPFIATAGRATGTDACADLRGRFDANHPRGQTGRVVVPNRFAARRHARDHHRHRTGPRTRISVRRELDLLPMSPEWTERAPAVLGAPPTLSVETEFW